MGSPWRVGEADAGKEMLSRVDDLRKSDKQKKRRSLKDLLFFYLESNQLSLDWLTLMPGPMVDATTQLLIY